MLMKKIKWGAAVLTAAALVGGGVGLWFRQPAAAEPPVRTRDVEAVPAARAAESPRPVGTWEREFGSVHMTMRIEADRIYGTCNLPGENGRKIDILADADYSITKDGVLYGVLTGVDFQGSAWKEGGNDVKQEFEMMRLLNDMPFSFRYRLDGDALTIKDVKFGDPNKPENEDTTAVLLGRWKKKADAHDATGRDGR